MAHFFGSGSTWEAKMSSAKQSETCSLVLVTFRCVQTYFRVPFIGSCIGRPRSHVKKASANVRECPSLSRRLLKCTQGCHWSFWTVRVDPTTLGTSDHHGHLEGSLGYPRLPTVPQNSIGSLRGDVRPDLCQSSLSSIPAGSVWCHSGLFNGKQPKPDPSTVQPDS
ncbi:hypothetical protein CDL15_Pgr023815 [Punica granatum]|uniref:Uncharacterized protein n=1 Tax=Punica granatum TaxID=22663 RepID=A0A218VYH6_PUNGR|nr:hypothetical protein CDL15_Pgr023815 [Punica granatum]